MHIDESFHIQAPIDRVWAFMTDPAAVGACVPGFVSAKQVSKDVFETVMKVKAGFFSLRMNAIARIVEKVEPRLMRVVGDGSGGFRAGRFTQETLVRLEEADQGGTDVSYRMDVEISGKLAAMAQKVLAGQAPEIGAQIVRNVKRKLET